MSEYLGDISVYYFKRKEFAVLGSKFFSVRADLSTDMAWCARTQSVSDKMCFPCKNGGSSTNSSCLLTSQNNSAS